MLSAGPWRGIAMAGVQCFWLCAGADARIPADNPAMLLDFGRIGGTWTDLFYGAAVWVVRMEFVSSDSQ